MPTPFQHLVYADRVLRHPALAPHIQHLLRQEIGAYLLGNTAADVQVLTGRPRVDTHFYRLRTSTQLLTAPQGSPVTKMLATLEPAAPRSPTHAAFLAGYAVHLVWDEIWAWDIFVPYYRDAAHWTDRKSIFVHHNALRVWLDRQAYQELRTHPQATLRANPQANLRTNPHAALPTNPQANLRTNPQTTPRTWPDLVAQLEAVTPHDWLPAAPNWALADWRDWLVTQLVDPAAVQTAAVFAERLDVPITVLNDLVDEMETGRYRDVPGLMAALADYEATALAKSIAILADLFDDESGRLAHPHCVAGAGLRLA